jgi:hypothetical protein
MIDLCNKLWPQVIGSRFSCHEIYSYGMTHLTLPSLLASYNFIIKPFYDKYLVNICLANAFSNRIPAEPNYIFITRGEKSNSIYENINLFYINPESIKELSNDTAVVQEFKNKISAGIKIELSCSAKDEIFNTSSELIHENLKLARKHFSKMLKTTIKYLADLEWEVNYLLGNNKTNKHKTIFDIYDDLALRMHPILYIFLLPNGEISVWQLITFFTTAYASESKSQKYCAGFSNEYYLLINGKRFATKLGECLDIVKGQLIEKCLRHITSCQEKFGKDMDDDDDEYTEPGVTKRLW